MTVKEAAEILRRHNEWRRYDGPIGEGPQMQDPALIGKAIDTLTAPEESLSWEDIRTIDELLTLVYEPDNEQGYYTRVLEEFNKRRQEK